eukprot:m.239125 g.239125  ORF g.239125 m.239125 type:complete len:252 (-) comp13424_c0_seq1:258-1013(-)
MKSTLRIYTPSCPMAEDVKALAALAAKKMAELLRASKRSAEFLTLEPVATEQDEDLSALSSSLQCATDEGDLYIKMSDEISTMDAATVAVKEQPTIISTLEKGSVAPPLHISAAMQKAINKKQRQLADTAGKKWYDLPATVVTPEIKRDLKLLQMRAVLDPKRFYKANDLKTLPKYFQMGTYVDNAADFYTSGANKKPRKNTLVEQLLSDSERRKYFKKKFTSIQQDRAKSARRPSFKAKNKMARRGKKSH